MLNVIAAICLFPPAVEIFETPNGGIQPQAVVDRRGDVHLLYYTGAAEGGDLNYTKSLDSGKTWQKPIRVNSIAKSAMAIGTIRGGQFAVTPSDEVHVIWLGTGKSESVSYSHKGSAENSFSPQVNLNGGTVNMDGGASIGADDKNVFVVWHASEERGSNEEKRRLWMRRSTDHGNSFSKQVPIDNLRGACGCCSVKAAVSSSGDLEVLYRVAFQSMDRDTYWIKWTGPKNVQQTLMDKWKLPQCPMSSYSILPNESPTRAWETEGRVVVEKTVLPGSSAKHPSLAKSGEYTLCAYVLESGWQRAGKLAWCVLDPSNRVVQSNLGGGVVPVWSLASAVALRDGRFAIFK